MEGPAPGVMNPGGLVPGVKPRRLQLIAVEPGGADGATVGVAVTRGDVAGWMMTVGTAPLALVTTGVMGAKDWLVLPPEPPGPTMRTWSRVMVCGGWSSSVHEAVVWLSRQYSLVPVSGSEMRPA